MAHHHNLNHLDASIATSIITSFSLIVMIISAHVSITGSHFVNCNNQTSNNSTNPCYPHGHHPLNQMPIYGNPPLYPPVSPYPPSPYPQTSGPSYPDPYSRMLPNYDIYGHRSYPTTGYPQTSQQFPSSYYPTHMAYGRQSYDPRMGKGYNYPPGYTGPQQQQVTTYPQYPGYPNTGYPIQPYNSNPYYPQQMFGRRMWIAPSKPDAKKSDDDPVFMNRGTIQIINGRDAEMTCTFVDPRYKMVSNVAWVKVTGPYDYYSPIPPFECTTPGCNYSHLNHIADFRYRVITIGQVSSLRIYDVTPADHGLYRCAATGQSTDGRTRTLYQVIEFLAPQHQHQPPPFNPQQPYPPQPYG